jgi:large subunit ribosomal protein L40e
MTRFPEAELRILNKKICMKCGATNAQKAVRCRRCKSGELRVKAKEGRGV